VLEVDKIDVYYGDIKALWEVSLVINEGEIVVLFGSNGAGKSTTLRTISGLLRPATGSITFNGLSLMEQAVHRIVELGIGLVPEEKKIFRGMTVLENLEMGAFLGSARQAKDAKMKWVYEVFPVLKERRKQKAGTLSGGEQQMLLISRALMSQPKLLMIDELSFGLAPLLVQNLFRTMRQIHESTGISILLVEQNVRMALEFSDRGYIIENGSIVAEGKAQDFLNRQQVKDAYFGIASEE
jgi:branched-chain amino acid transport system ATP-binding protein